MRPLCHPVVLVIQWAMAVGDEHVLLPTRQPAAWPLDRSTLICPYAFLTRIRVTPHNVHPPFKSLIPWLADRLEPAWDTSTSSRYIVPLQWLMDIARIWWKWVLKIIPITPDLTLHNIKSLVKTWRMHAFKSNVKWKSTSTWCQSKKLKLQSTKSKLPPIYVTYRSFSTTLC
jgi:hypothetical protein